MLHVVFDFNLVDNVALHQILQHPAQMLRGDAEHGRAKASGVIEGDDLLTFRREFLAHTVTRWISVPTANMAPDGASRIIFSKPSVEPTASAFWQTSRRHAGWAITRMPGYLARTLSTCSGRKR